MALAALVKQNLKQTAVYWSPGVKDEHSRVTFNAAIEILVRWEDKTETFLDSEGRESISKAIVFTDRELARDGYLFLGAESTLDSDHSDPAVITDAHEVKQNESMTRLKQKNEFIYKVWL